jgi:hypothetical protein
MQALANLGHVLSHRIFFFFFSTRRTPRFFYFPIGKSAPIVPFGAILPSLNFGGSELAAS